MRSILLVVLLFLIPFPATAVSDDVTGNELLGFCESNDSGKVACVSYVMGYVNGMKWGGSMQKTERKVCLPEGTTYNQLMMLFVKRAHDHPERLNNAAGLELGAMLAATYPCEKP